MEILGKRGLGNYLKILLLIVLIFGILILVVFPIVMQKTNLGINPNIIILYPNAICLLLIIYQFIGLFDSLKQNNPFCENTVKRLKKSEKICLIAAIFWLIDCLYEILVVTNENLLIIIIEIFMFILFVGVTIALYILAELFSKAIEYKSENDLTI